MRRSASIWLDKYFYPRSPCGERLEGREASGEFFVFLSTLSLRRATSLHRLSGSSSSFLSTLSLRRATKILLACCAPPYNFYPRSPCGERPAGNKAGAESFKFLSTLSLRRATSQCRTLARGIYGFLSTLSLRRATLSYYFRKYLFLISIHALLAESDCSFCPANSQRGHFYPRSPCGERLSKNAAMGNPTFISIHALLAESDGMLWVMEDSTKYFYPRSPCGERRDIHLSKILPRPISIHALLAESDTWSQAQTHP